MAGIRTGGSVGQGVTIVAILADRVEQRRGRQRDAVAAGDRHAAAVAELAP
jgi:hypothetical protein